jgi:phosphoribosylformylglycinamidine cyclo-ligase
MYRTFNMGVGMVIVCSRTDLDPVKSHLKERGDKCYQIGAVVEGNREVLL